MAESESSSTSPPQGTVFHFFPKLPIELRFEIWRLLLPHRVCEKDQPFYEIVFKLLDEKTPSPCLLYQTTEVNGRAARHQSYIMSHAQSL
ncbi:hypothetical protein BGW36DRAFT_65627 [Talaromyces proteolyticus]|uniref:2EXR domain-containing protein n=1 Tax=Talaromyces proteolyticus TaxID=1131652 RepID=A0AAD4KEE7_9EURO|nr:uncharacterized protein BGW36DRAFT_65627 [Talaromyces proteolyticus]KAH8689970.1 hypothetical protein BGW36DRAFT_65627 [Talaromyces proteolyticus]